MIMMLMTICTHSHYYFTHPSSSLINNELNSLLNYEWLMSSYENECLVIVTLVVRNYNNNRNSIDISRVACNTFGPIS